MNKKTSIGYIKNEPLCDSLLLYKLYEWQKDKFCKKEADVLYNQSFSILEEEIIPFSYIDGILGIHWYFATLERKRLITDRHALVPQLKKFVISDSFEDIDRNYYDPSYGLGSKIVFLHRNNCVESLNKLVNSALSTENRENVISYFENDKPSYFSKAHGFLGFCSCLLIAYPSLKEKGKRLVRETTTHINDSIQNISNIHNGHSVLPSIPIEEGSEDVRLGWCYGDFGLFQYLLLYEKYLNETVFSDLRERVSKKIIDRTVSNALLNKEEGRLDISICHGLCGITLLMEHYGLKKERMSYWLEATNREYVKLLKNIRTGLKDDLSNRFNTETTFLEGALGVELYLQMKEGKYMMPWKELLLL